MELPNFEHNVKSIRKEYEAYVLSIGEYDERVFLGDDADEDIGTPAKNVPTSTGNLFYFFCIFSKGVSKNSSAEKEQLFHF